MGWIYLAQDKNQCKTLVNMAMNLCFCKMLENFWKTNRMEVSEDAVS
jgi:hypothetical protein